MFSFVDQNYYMTYDEGEIQRTVGFQFADWKAGIGWGNQQSSTTYGFSEESFQWITFYGGDATLALTNQWDQWINSTNFARAINDYYERATPTMQLHIYLKMSLQVSEEAAGEFVLDYKNTCTWKHGFLSEEHSTFASLGSTKANFRFQGIPPGYYEPGIVPTGAHSVGYTTKSGYYACRPNAFIYMFNVVTFDYECVLDGHAVDVLGGPFYCLGLTIAI